MQHVPRVADVGTRFAMTVGVCISQTELQRDSCGEPLVLSLCSDLFVLIIDDTG